jgi:hypothetical protein
MAYLSRVEKILVSNIEGTPYTDKPLSRVEALLLEEGGGGEISEATFEEYMDEFEERYEITPAELDAMWNHTNNG